MADVDLQKRNALMRLRPQWASIAQDVVLTRIPNDDKTGMLVTPQEICDAYGMTQAECVALLRLPEFRRLVDDYKKRVDAMGDNASITLRAQMLAADMMEDVYLSAKMQGADLKDKISVMKMLFQYGGLDPATNGTNRQSNDKPGGNAGSIATIVINVPPGIPGMEHVSANARVIEGETVHGSDAS